MFINLNREASSDRQEVGRSVCIVYSTPLPPLRKRESCPAAGCTRERLGHKLIRKEVFFVALSYRGV